mgnify:CR=1 FL=1
MIAKKTLSFFLVFVAGMVTGVRMIFNDAFDLGHKSAVVNDAIYQEPSRRVISTIVDTMNSLPIIANVMAQINWGYIQWSLLILFILGLAFVAWPSKKRSIEEQKKVEEEWRMSY